MKVYYAWNRTKNEQLKEERGISFENVLQAMASGGLLDEIEHRHLERYPGQRIFVVVWNQYVYDVPFVRNGDEIFLKTIIPNRKATRDYKRASL